MARSSCTSCWDPQWSVWPVPLAREWGNVRQLALPIAGAMVVGSLVALGSAVGIAWLLGASPATLLSLAPKSVTAPIAMGIAEKIGGLLAVATGVIGATFGKYVLDGCRVFDWRARGFALGLAAHGIGTARAFAVNADAGAFAGLAFALHGLAAALLLPVGFAVWSRFG